MVKIIIFTLKRLEKLSYFPTVFESSSPSLNENNKNKTYMHTRVYILVEIRNAIRLTNTNLTKF